MNMSTSESKSKVKSIITNIGTPLLVAAVAFVLMLVTGFHIVTVEGTSMENTLLSGEKIISTNFLYTPQNGDIVVISMQNTKFKNIIKRVIAVEGQTLELDYDNNKIYVDGKQLEEPYLDCSTFEGNRGNYDIPSVIPEGKIFVLGDNRGVSLDSRNSTIGLVDKKDVVGKAHFTIFPFDRFGGYDNK